MDGIHLVPIQNPWAILVSALILFVLGAAWYSPLLFIKPWMRALGTPPPPSGSNVPKKGLFLAVLSSVAGNLLASFVLWHMVAWSGAVTFPVGAFVGFLCWLSFIAATQFPRGLYEKRPIALFAINSGYWLIGLLLAGGLLAVWQ